ncbi:MAG: hypothetical protein HOH96_07360 [Flavobacteriales bacterium]|jgi:hypothetical protein|nr:hypothetical protein [Flavobacteriales bacterium]
MKHTFLIFSTVLLTTLSSDNITAQTNTDLPGSEVITSIYPELSLNSDEGMRLCCFAAYGWYSTPKLKFETNAQPLPGEGDDIAKRLLNADIVSEFEEQFFIMENDIYVVVSKIDIFEKLLTRYIINANAKTK